MKFSQIIEAPLDSLLAYCQSTPAEESVDALYAHFLTAYLQNNTTEMEKLAYSALFKQCAPELRSIIWLRLQLRQKSLKKTSILKIEEDIIHFPDWLKGEAYFVCALASLYVNDHEASLRLFLESSRWLKIFGSEMKALKSDLNALTEKSHLFPKLSLMIQYHHLYKESVKIGDRIVGGLCLLNISREYQKVGSLNSALSQIQKALTLLSRDYGTMHYYLALASRAHIFLDLNRVYEALLDFEAASFGIHFPEVKSALSLLQPHLHIQNIKTSLFQVDDFLLLDTWKERFSELQNEGRLSDQKQQSLSPLEEKFLSIISRGPKTRLQILKSLWSPPWNLEILENRFKNVVGRIRKKKPGLLVYVDGKYQLSQETHEMLRKSHQ